MKIALLGGSFNPPHVGHLLAVHFVRATEPVDQVWMVPAYRHPFGKPLAEFEHRLRMCELLCEDTSGWLRASDVERQVGGEGRTVDTLQYLAQRFPEHRLTLVLGSDILDDLPHWKDFDRIQELAKILVIQRAGYPSAQAVGPPLTKISSTEVRALLLRKELPSHWLPRRVLEYAHSHKLYGL